MFYTPKPRQFKYRPRFYDPEKEKWEALKQKYADERMLREAAEQARLQESPAAAAPEAGATETAGDLAYFERRLRELDRDERHTGLTWKDAFRKREMPKFNYQPRFATPEATTDTTGEHLNSFKKRGANIKRRFDVSDTDYMKPVPAGRIMLYALLVCALLYWILF